MPLIPLEPAAQYGEKRLRSLVTIYHDIDGKPLDFPTGVPVTAVDTVFIPEGASRTVTESQKTHAKEAKKALHAIETDDEASENAEAIIQQALEQQKQLVESTAIALSSKLKEQGLELSPSLAALYVNAQLTSGMKANEEPLAIKALIDGESQHGISGAIGINDDEYTGRYFYIGEKAQRIIDAELEEEAARTYRSRHPESPEAKDDVPMTVERLRETDPTDIIRYKKERLANL